MARYCAVEGGSLQIRLKKDEDRKKFTWFKHQIIDHLDKYGYFFLKTWYMRNLSYYHNLSPEEWWCQWCQWCPLTFKFTMVPHGVPMVSPWCPIENPGASPRYEASVEKNSSKRPALRPACEAREFSSSSWSIIQITSLRDIIYIYIYACIYIYICIYT